METEVQAQAVPEPAPAPVAPVVPPANNLTQTERDAKGSEAIDIDSMSESVLDQVSDNLRNLIPSDAKGKALDKAREVVAKGTPAELEEKEVVPPVAAEPAPEPAPIVADPANPIAEVIPPAPENIAPEPEPEKNPQRRVRGEKPEDDMALDIFQTRQRIGKPISMLEASLEANRILGIGEAEPEPGPAPKTVDVAKTELDTLWAEYSEADKTFDENKPAIMRKIHEKEEEIRDIKQDEVARSQRQQHEVQSARQQSAGKAAALYPDLAVIGSPIENAKNQIHQALVESSDPIVNTADYPLHLGQLAAAQTKTPPKLAGQPAPASKPVPSRSVQPAKPVAPLTSATARTTTPPKGQAVEAALDGMSGRQLDELVSALSPHIRRS